MRGQDSPSPRRAASGGGEPWSGGRPAGETPTHRVREARTFRPSVDPGDDPAGSGPPDLEVVLETVPFERKSVLRNLMELAQHDYATWSGSPVGEDGLYGYRYLDHYWTEPGRWPDLLRVEGEIAGFVLVRALEDGPGNPWPSSLGPAEGPYHGLAEFFVLGKFRGRGVGRAAAGAAFRRHQGRWQVNQDAANRPALAFWRRVVDEVSGGHWHDGLLRGQPTQWFRNDRPGGGG